MEQIKKFKNQKFVLVGEFLDLQSGQTVKALEDVSVKTTNAVVGQVSATHTKFHKGLFVVLIRIRSVFSKIN